MRVLEISCGSASGYAGLLLSQLQFDVDRIDQSEGPLGDDLFLHRDKNLIENVGDPFRYDAIVEDVGPEGLKQLGWSYRALRDSHKNLVIVSLSPYGLSGPYKDWKATELTVQAAGGVMHSSGYDGEAPLKLPGDSAALISGLHGATAVVSAVYGIEQGTECGVHIDISAQDTFMHHWTRHISQYAYSGTLMRRGKRDAEGIHACHTAMAKDGWIYMLALRAPWQDVAAFLGLGEFVHFEADNRQPWQEMEDPFHRAIAEKTRYEWFTEAASMGWTFAPVEDPLQIVNNPQSSARSFYETRKVDGMDVPIPGLPFRFDP